MSSIENLSKNIVRLREELGLTQDQLSDKANISHSTLSKIEQGQIKSPSVFTVLAIANSLETKITDLLSIDPLTDQSQIKFLLCDVNGVVVRFFQRAFTMLSKDTGLDVGKIEMTFWHYNAASNKGEMTLSEFNKAMNRALEIDCFDWKKYYFSAIEPVKEMHGLIKELADQMPVGLLTNTAPELIDDMIKQEFIPNVKYKTIIDSSKVHAIKPENRVYEIAEKMSGYKGSEILFVDDSRTNLMAAEKYNWRVIWFDDFRPDESVKRIKEALNLAD